MDEIESVNAIIGTTKITVSPENRKELFQTIASLLGPIRSEVGCLNYRFYLEAEDANSFALIGEWATRVDWDNHLRSDNFAVLLGSIMILSVHSNIDFKLLSQVASLETVTRGRMWCQI